MQSTKYLIFLAVWKRPEITEICFMGIDRLRKTGLFPIDAFAVISEPSMIPLCEKYNIDYCFHENQPLGKKKNFGLTEAMKKDWDYLIEIGSDDLIKNEAFNYYDDSQIQFFNRLFFINSFNGDCCEYITKTPFGLGRKIRRDVIENYCRGVVLLAKSYVIYPGRNIPPGRTGFLPVKVANKIEGLRRGTILGDVSYKLWKDDQERGLDNQSGYYLNKAGASHKIITTEKSLLIDIKSEVNIWSYNTFNGSKTELYSVLEGISEGEKEAIMSLIEKQCLVQM